MAPVNNFSDLPPELNPCRLCEKEDEKTVAYFGGGSPLSNFFPAPFVIDKQEFNSTEQFIQATKAGGAGEDVIKHQILTSNTAYEAKIHSKKISVDTEEWQKEAKNIALTGCLEKFTQNDTLRRYLLRTGSKQIIEATKDEFWGSGIPLHNEKCLSKKSWTGQNTMGKVLMEIRDILQSDTPPEVPPT